MIKNGSRVKIVDPKPRTTDVYLIFGLVGQTGTVMGRYEELISHKYHDSYSNGRFVVCVDEPERVRLASSFIDDKGILHEDWYVVPSEGLRGA